MILPEKNMNIFDVSSLGEEILIVLKARERFTLEVIDCLNAERTHLIGFGRYYVELNRLRLRKLVHSRWLSNEKRTLYAITEAGKAVLDEKSQYRQRLSSRFLN